MPIKTASELVPLINNIIHKGFDLPRSGEFSGRDIANFVTRISLINMLYSELFGNESFEQYAVNNPFHHYESGDVAVTFENNCKGFRFNDKSKRYLTCTIENETDIYKLIIPLHKDNAELFLYGVFSLSEPSRMMDWIEYGFVAKSKLSTKETKEVFTFSNTYRQGEVKKIDPQEYFCLARLEDAAMHTFSMLNNRRLAELDVLQTDHEILRAWSKMFIDCNSQNTFDFIKPESPVTVDSSWHIFENFLAWSLENGFEKDNLLIRKNSSSGNFEPDNCEWSADQIWLADRYYWHYFDNTFHLSTRIVNINLPFRGETKSVQELSEIANVPWYILVGRWFSGLKEEQLVSPMTKKVVTYLHQEITINGETKTAKEWAEFAGITPNTIVSRIRYGWRGEDLISPPQTRMK